jgi:hypothetical protein
MPLHREGNEVMSPAIVIWFFLRKLKIAVLALAIYAALC